MPEAPPVLVLLLNRFFDHWPNPDPAACMVACEFTRDRRRLPHADAVIVHVPSLAEPLPRVLRRGQFWVAWSMDSEVTVPAMANPEFLARFNLTMTHRRDADIWVPYVGTASRPALLTPPTPKTASRPVCHFQSNPYDRSGGGWSNWSNASKSTPTAPSCRPCQTRGTSTAATRGSR